MSIHLLRVPYAARLDKDLKLLWGNPMFWQMEGISPSLYIVKIHCVGALTEAAVAVPADVEQVLQRDGPAQRGRRGLAGRADAQQPPPRQHRKVGPPCQLAAEQEGRARVTAPLQAQQQRPSHRLHRPSTVSTLFHVNGHHTIYYK